MSSRFDAMETAFLMHEIANRSDPYLSNYNIVSRVLGRQNLAEITVDHNRGLREALQLANECKSLLRSELYAEAVVVFVKAFVTSPFCLEPLEEVTERLTYALNLVLHNHMKSHGHHSMPHVCKAAKLIMIGFKMIGLLPTEEAIHLAMEDSSTYRDWQQHQVLHRLGTLELQWALNVASFKACYRQALQCRVECDHLAGQLVGMVQDALTNMNMTNQYHPLVLQGIVQWQMLEESPEMPLEFTWDAMDGRTGYNTALKRLGDPALAINHLLQTMYTNLQATLNYPNAKEKLLLQGSANQIMQLVEYLQQEPPIWDSVKGRILASMFLLAHTWDLASFLKNHALVSFIVEQHNLQRESLLRPAPSPEPIREESLQEFDDEFKSLLEKIDDAKLKEERQLVDLRCTRCERRIVTKSEAIQCQQCHIAFYCSPECQRKHAQSHKGPCKRAKLKAKLAAKPSTK